MAAPQRAIASLSAAKDSKPSRLMPVSRCNADGDVWPWRAASSDQR